MKAREIITGYALQSINKLKNDKYDEAYLSIGGRVFTPLAFETFGNMKFEECWVLSFRNKSEKQLKIIQLARDSYSRLLS